jgi:ureidoglycolate hydrolase
VSEAPGGLEIRRLPVRHLDAVAFAPYGAVIGPETADSPNLNRAPGYLGYLWIQKALEFPRQAYVGCVRYYYRATRCEFVQKHPASTVVLIPLGLRASVIFVATDDGADRPDLATAQAFLLEGGRGVVLHRGTWVRYAFPLAPFVDFAYVTQRVDPATANSSDDVVRSRLDVDFGLVLDVEFQAIADLEIGPGGAVVSGRPRNPPLE